MEQFIFVWNQLMCIAVFAAMATSVVLLYTLIVPEHSFSVRVTAFIKKYILDIGFFIALGAVISSLVYSNIIGFPPCLLCWYTRIAFYPQAILFGIALWKKDLKIIDYTLGLTLFGLIISTYHVISENIGFTVLPCEASGPSCLIKYVYEYGFITIPVMGLVSFITLLLVLLVAKRALKTRV